jgi:hypothetical protein
MTAKALSYLCGHGMGNEFAAEDKATYDAVFEFPFVLALALICYYSGESGVFDLQDAYPNGVRAMNTLAILIDKLRNIPRVRKRLIDILEKIWDIGICLLGIV